MEVMLILRSVRRNSIGAILISLQIALTLAIICNALSITQQRLRYMSRPTGIDEANIWTLRNQWVGEQGDLKARLLGDMAVLRSIPGVVDAEPTNSFPLWGAGWTSSIKLSPNQNFPTARTAVYFADEHAMSAYGLELSAGRWFNAAEIEEVHSDEDKFPAAVIVTQSLARGLFPYTDPLGQVMYFGRQPARIIGIVKRAQTPFTTQAQGHAQIDDATFFPFLYLSNDTLYLVRTLPGQLAAVMKSAQDRLFQIEPLRVVSSVRTFAQVRHDTFSPERKASVILAVVCGLLLAVTAFGVVGLTMYWVAQRRRYIGMRRALGARRSDILRYFHLENLMIAGGGVLLGVALGLSSSIWLASTMALSRMSAEFICIGAVIVLSLCQLAVIWPALRAASVPPAIAARGK